MKSRSKQYPTENNRKTRRSCPYIYAYKHIPCSFFSSILQLEKERKKKEIQYSLLLFDFSRLQIKLNKNIWKTATQQTETKSRNSPYL